ncbi:DUF6503 family protein [Cellulophaga sp. 20_2_10]|uniref:DUF6503 family protein n=1 Tax=Cellulophaga sp. 20_2_10 TaxID=2942476 RepID=UPI00201A3990|nr:DUF6503 family protein [Cellulophaga sp. 20_2_10]MCL5245585.1 DUF6503 family protein [Cellulophaga sp. 20_2_10]
MINRFLLLFLCLFTFVGVSAQDISASEFLNTVIARHDPGNNWESFKGDLVVTMSTPNKEDRVTDLHIDLPASTFVLSNVVKGKKHTTKVVKDSVSFFVYDKEIKDKEEQKTLKFNKERALFMRNYYTYLYGLPMKLKDNGTIIDPKVVSRKFKGKGTWYNVIKVTYNKEVGKDTWYFYFNPKSLDMEIYQFFHDESKNDGEYIMLSNTEIINGVRMPAIRAWYTNKEDKLLGTDVLTAK